MTMHVSSSDTLTPDIAKDLLPQNISANPLYGSETAFLTRISRRYLSYNIQYRVTRKARLEYREKGINSETGDSGRRDEQNLFDWRGPPLGT